MAGTREGTKAKAAPALRTASNGLECDIRAVRLYHLYIYIAQPSYPTACYSTARPSKNPHVSHLLFRRTPLCEVYLQDNARARRLGISQSEGIGQKTKFEAGGATNCSV